MGMKIIAILSGFNIFNFLQALAIWALAALMPIVHAFFGIIVLSWIAMIMMWVYMCKTCCCGADDSSKTRVNYVKACTALIIFYILNAIAYLVLVIIVKLPFDQVANFLIGSIINIVLTLWWRRSC